VFQYKPHYINAVKQCRPKTATNTENLELHPQTCNITGPREMSTADGAKETTFVMQLQIHLDQSNLTGLKYRGADKSLARSTSRCILFDG